MIPFEPQLFGTAANNGQMIAEFSSSHRTADAFRGMARLLTGRSDDKKSRTGLLLPLIHKLMKRGRRFQKMQAA